MPLSYPLHQHTLPNGLQVVVSPDHSAPVVTVNLWVKVGSGHEQPGRTGFAHLFEHLMFQGSRSVAEGEHFSALMAQGGQLNATTWYDRTNYFETVPTGALDLALWLEADRHGHLLDAVTQANLDNQRDVVKEEKRQRYDNQPYGDAMTTLLGAVFPPGHPYHHPTIGSMEDLDAATLEDVHAFFADHYGPANTVLTLCGDISPEEGLAAAERWFGHLAPGARAHVAQQGRTPGQGRGRADAPLAPLESPARLELAGEVPTERVYLAWRLPAEEHPEFLPAAMALDVLGGLATSRLYRRLVRAEQSAHSVSASAMGLRRGTSAAIVVVDIVEGHSAQALERAVCEELERLVTEPPTPAEVEAALAETERGWLATLAAPDERADLISHYAALYDDPGRINTWLDDVRAVTSEQIAQATATWLQPRSRVTLTYRTAQEAAA